MSKAIFTFLAISLIGLAVSLTACNTTQGFGKDVQASGKAISSAAQDAK